MNLKTLVFTTCLIISLSLWSNSHIKQYKIIFPTGSSIVTGDVYQQLVTVYNQIPELQFSTVKCKDTISQDHLHQHTLSRQRAKNILDIFLSFGMDKRHVKISYGSDPVVLVFKPRAIYKTTSYVTDQISQHKTFHSFKADKKSYFLSKLNHLFVFVPYSFESLDGTILKEGDVQIELTELSNNDDIIKCGVIGDNRSCINEYGLYIHLAAHQNGKALRLRSGYVYKVLIDSNQVSSYMQSYRGNVIDEVMVWRSDKQAKLKEVFLNKGKPPNTQLTSIKEGIKTEWLLSSLGWNKCERKIDVKKTSKLLVSLEVQEQYALYLASNNSRIVISASENLNFRNLYEFTSVPHNGDFQLVALPVNKDLPAYYFNESYSAGLKFSSLKLEQCDQPISYECLKIR